ncbi:MAG: molecular chaperone HtpG [Raoultibacter sp.]
MRKFKTESKKLLDLMINSIYTHKDIFLRELISNASDATDKLYFKSLTDSSIEADKETLAIRISFDKDARTITVSDHGIGMTKEELEGNLGTIAHSDSQNFKTENSEQQGGDIDIIGQFGVGFYAAFMVADNVKVISRAQGSDQAYLWESSGAEGYTITEAEKSTCGTDIILSLKPDTDEEDYSSYVSEYGLKQIIKKYSNYVRYPIQMECQKSRQLPKPEDAGDDYQPQFEDYTEVETINSMTPIWKRKKSEVGQEEYNEFYKTDFHDFTDPARTISIHAEGTLSYDALLFVPGRAPYDLYSKDYQKGLALYSSGVQIMEKCEDLLPDYFNFVRGVVDSQDLSLNISRETLQHNSQLVAIARKIEKKIKSDLTAMRNNDREAYETFFENFGRALKYGIYSSYGMSKDLLGDLLLFHSAKQDKMVTLDEYIESMGVDQESIFYAAGESVSYLAKTPIVKSVLDKGYDILLCTEDVDEFCLTAMQTYGEKELKNVAGGDLGLESDDEKSAAETAEKENEGLLATMKETLGDQVSKVSVSTRLGDAPVCITAQGPVSLEMEKTLAGAPEGNEVKAERVLEVNAEHPIFKTLQKAQEAGDADRIKLYTDVLYNQALLIEGMPLADPIAYAQSVCDLMK